MDKYSAFIKNKSLNIKKISGNKNNHSFMIGKKSKRQFIKVFKRKSSFQRELNFYSNFKNSIIKKNIPKILLYSEKEKYIILEFIEFKKFNSQEEYLKCLYKFIVDTNSVVIKDKWNSRERLKSPKNLIHKIELRIKKLMLISKKNNSKHPKLKILLKLLTKKLNAIKDKVAFKKISKNKEIISQSDIGIHNSGIINGRPVFFDFEYSGMDNPIKMISDIYYQPELSIKYENYKIFLKKLIKHFDYKFNKNDILIEQLLKIKMIMNICNIFVKKKYILNNMNELYLENLKKKRLIKCFKIFKKKSFLA